MYCKNLTKGTIKIDTLRNTRGEVFRLGSGEVIRLGTALWPEPRIDRHKNQFRRYVANKEMALSETPFPKSKSQAKRYESTYRKWNSTSKKESKTVEDREE